MMTMRYFTKLRSLAAVAINVDGNMDDDDNVVVAAVALVRVGDNFKFSFEN